MPPFIFSIASFLSDDNESLFAKKLISTLAEITSFDSWMLVHFKPEKTPEIICCRDDLRSCVEYVEKYFKVDPFYIAVKGGYQSEFMTLRDLKPKFFCQSQYFQNFLETSFGFSDQVAYTCCVNHEETYMLVLERSGNFNPFRDCEVKKFRKVAAIVSAMLMVIWIKRQAQKKPTSSSPKNEINTRAEAIMHNLGAIALSPREKEILRLLLAGESAKSVGRLLDISPGTAQCHIKNIYLKLGISSRGELFGRFFDEFLENQVA